MTGRISAAEQVFNGADGAIAIHSRRSIEGRGLEAGEREAVAERFTVFLGHHVLPGERAEEAVARAGAAWVK